MGMGQLFFSFESFYGVWPLEFVPDDTKERSPPIIAKLAKKRRSKVESSIRAKSALPAVPNKKKESNHTN